MQFDIVVVLVRPEHPENIGLVARNMKNTGFQQLRLVGVPGIPGEAFKTAVHARDILDCARVYARLEDATADCDVVFAATAKKRKNYSLLTFDEAVEKIGRFPGSNRIGILFGNERTGLISEELKYSNFRFIIPQAARQPSFNIASAVLITLFHVFSHPPRKARERGLAKPLPQKKQLECIEMILRKLGEKGFIHKTNRKHTTEMVYDLFGRLNMTEEDSRLLLAIFSKGVDS